MKIAINIILFVFTILLAASLVTAHEGMIAFFSDSTASACHEILPEYRVIKLPLFYVRGDGPRLGSAVGFRISKSSSGISLGVMEFFPIHGLVQTFGSLENDISILYHAGETWCAPDDETFFLGNIPVVNLSDPDTFTVSVVLPIKCPPFCAIQIVPCGTYEPVSVIGGTFVFNGDCYAPDDPFGSPTGVESSSWGAIKKLSE